MADLEKLIQRSSAKQIRDKVTRRVLQTIHTMTDQRIFKDGKDANDQALGYYSPKYMKRRISGYYWVRKGVSKKITYPEGRKIILQATSQMANDYKFLTLRSNRYGSGFSNKKNFDKSEYVENTYGKEIFKLTASEEKKLEKLLDKELEKFLNV